MSTAQRWRKRLGGLAAFALGGVLVFTVLAVLARDWWVSELALSVQPHLMAVALATAILALAVRRWLVAAAAVVLAVPNALALAGPFAEPVPPARGEGDGVVSVAAINVMFSNPDHGALVDLVRSDPPDVLILMEALQFWQPALRELEPLFPYGMPQRWADGHWLIVASALPILEARIERDAGIGWPWAILRLEGPRGPFTVIALHPPPPVGAANVRHRRAYLMAVADDAAAIDGPVVAAGDFNAVPWSPDYRDFAVRSGLRDVARGQGWQPTWPARLGFAGIPIDRVAVSPGISLADLQIGPAIGSDHLPVIADLAMPARPGTDD